MVYRTSDNNFGTAKWIVDATAGQGTHTTIATALTSASSGDTIFIRPGTYTENLTLKAGVNLTAFGSDSSLNQTGTVIISGKATFTAAGSVTIAGIQLQTNSDFLLAVTGSAASIVNLQDCNLNCSNNTGISFTSSNSAATITCTNCSGNLGTTGIAYFASTSNGTLNFFYCQLNNSGSSVTASTISAGVVAINNCFFVNPITTSSTASFQADWSYISTGNTTVLTAGGSGGHNSDHSDFNSGTASAISVGNNLTLTNATITSSNTNAITGAGSLTYGGLIFSGSSRTINTTTQSYVDFKVVIQVFTSTGTYTPTAGMKYCVIEAVGGGGGGGGAAAPGAGQASAAVGGSAGEYGIGVFSSSTVGASQSVTIGAAGTAGTAGNNAGGGGGTTSVGSTLISAVGGSGGTGSPAGATTALGSVSGGTGGTGGSLHVQGNAGGAAFAITGINAQIQWGGIGGSTRFGSGGTQAISSINSVAGGAGTGNGSGGSGGVSAPSQAAAAGGAGTKGIVVITEYVIS